MSAIDIALVLLLVHAALGAFDTFWNHELAERLPHRAGAATELALHSLRSLAFFLLFGGLTWFDWHGAWGIALLGLVGAEYVVTIVDSVVEDRTRRLSVVERVNHMLLAVNTGLYAAFLAVGARSDWGRHATALVPTHRGVLSWLLSAAAAGVAAWALRDALAAWRLRRRAAPARD